MHLFLSHLHPHTCIHFNLVWGSFPRVDTNIIPLSWTAIFPLDSRRCPVPLPSTFWQNFSLSWRKLLLSVVTKSFFPSPAYGLACSLAYSSLCPLIKFCEQRPSDDHKMPEPQCHALKERVPQGLWDLYNDWAEWSQAFSWQTLNTCYTIHKMFKLTKLREVLWFWWQNISLWHTCNSSSGIHCNLQVITTLME